MSIYSIIQKSQLEGAKRMDAEYYQPEYLFFSKIIGFSKRKISDVVEFIKHPIEIERIYQDRGSPFLLTQNIDSSCFLLEFESRRFISEERAKKIMQNKLKIGDVVMTRTGANYGDSSLYLGEPEELLASAHILIIRPRDIGSAFLVSFLNSKAGRALVNRGVYGGLQPEITSDYISSIPIPEIDNKTDKYFTEIINNAFNNLKLFRRLYKEAEDILLKELNIDNFKKNDYLFTVVNLSEAKTANRFDAEYFNSPCNKILAQISKIKTAKLGDLVEMTKGVEPGAEAYQDEGKLFIRVSSISKDGIIDKDQKYLSEELFNKYKKDYQPQAGEILLTKDASPGIVCLVRQPIEGIVASGVMRLKLKEKINLEYLTLVLNSIVGRLQAERDAGGSIIAIAHWKPEQIKNLIVPILPASTQNKIGDLLLRSYQARKRAKELLDEAKSKVEEMIENNQAPLNFQNVLIGRAAGN